MANLGYIQVSRECNQNCRFCSNPPNDVAQTIEAAKDQLDSLVKLGYEGVILTGGEPTLCPFLKDIIHYSVAKGLPARIITNGQLTADRGLLEDYVRAGLSQMHVSLHSYRPEVQAFLTGNESSLENAEKTLDNAKSLGLKTDVNTVINRYNCDHLHETVDHIMNQHPNVTHFVFNNIDPRQNRASKHSDVISQPWMFELSLFKAMALIDKRGGTFRVERVPLCFMADFAHCSTEARKIVKAEERTVFFLDKKGMVRQTEWRYTKSEACDSCNFNQICAGLFEGGEYYDLDQLHAVFLDEAKVRERIMASN
ncbi:MAG: radical SAM protein [Deltaproteobacteria bacterium]|nr:radical SAM protein [Deltaproteobacteria bacterium]